MVHPKCEIILMLSILDFFSLAPCKGIALNLLCFLFCFQFFASFLYDSLHSYCSINYRYKETSRSFSLLNEKAKRFRLLFNVAFKSEKEQQQSMFEERYPNREQYGQQVNILNRYNKKIKSRNIIKSNNWMALI